MHSIFAGGTGSKVECNSYALGSYFQFSNLDWDKRSERGNYVTHVYASASGEPDEKTGGFEVWPILGAVGYVHGMDFGCHTYGSTVFIEAVGT